MPVSPSLPPLTFDAALFYVAIECLAGFFCCFSAMLFRQYTTTAGHIDSFRPRILTSVGVLHLLHAALLLLYLPNPPEWLFAPERFIQIALCWGLVANFWWDRGRFRLWPDMFRFGVLTAATTYSVARWITQLNTDDYMPLGRGAAICWLVALSMYYDRRLPEVMLPVSYRVFCLLGFMSHAVVACGSRYVLDGPFFLGSLLRDCQYGYLALAILSAHLFGFSSKTWAQRQVLESAKQNCADAAGPLEETKNLIKDAQSHMADAGDSSSSTANH